MASATAGEARTHIQASSARVYDLVTDVTRMGEWSPETSHCDWLDGATGPAVGNRFRGTNRLGVLTWHTECTITAADPGREFAFSVLHPNGREETRWRYTFTAAGTGTEVVETYQFLWCPAASRLLETFVPRDRQLRRGIRTTLANLKAAAERG